MKGFKGICQYVVKFCKKQYSNLPCKSKGAPNVLSVGFYNSTDSRWEWVSVLNPAEHLLDQLKQAMNRRSLVSMVSDINSERIG